MLVMIDEIEGVIVMVSDQEKALEFYTKKIGFAKKVDTMSSGFRWIVVAPRDSNAVISLVSPLFIKDRGESLDNLEKRIGQSTGIWFYSKNIAQTYQELKSKGVKVTEPKKQIWGGILCTVYDQDNNSFSLIGDSEN